MSSSSSSSVGLDDVRDQKAAQQLKKEEQELPLPLQENPEENGEADDAEKKEAEDAKARAKRLQVKKVSPCKRFFSSIRVVFILVTFIFFFVTISVIGYSMIHQTRILYEAFDELDMKERIQNAAHGTLAALVTTFTRPMMALSMTGMLLYPEGNTTDSFTEMQTKMAAFIYSTQQQTTEGPGLAVYESLPFHLFVGWDENWTQRFAYYRPCNNVKEHGKCDLPPPEETFVDALHGDFTLKHEADIPPEVLEIPEIMKKKTGDDAHMCETFLKCAGILDVSDEYGGPLVFHMFGYGDSFEQNNASFIFTRWHFFAAANIRLLSQIQANRTGLCVSHYSESETDLPEEEVNEFKVKKDKNLTLNPVDMDADPMTFVVTMYPDTGNISLSQDYYSDKKRNYVSSDREICDDFYDHGDDDFVSKSKVYLDYSTFNFTTGKQDREHTVMFRFDYHDPLTEKYVKIINIVVVVVIILFFLTNLGVYLFFEVNFLYPLDQMRKVREDMIKTAMAGLDEDETKARELFGDLINDEALIKANGDEITVMLTLQDRMDALYSNVIKTRIEELIRLRTVSRNGALALRVMNLFMRRDDDALRIVLPGLLDSNEMARRFRRTTLNVRAKGESWMDVLANAKHMFRTLKAVLSNHIATQYFKAFCTQRGRSSVNSFFFMMDVSWLHQVESGARDENEDFLSAMFSDSVSTTPGSTSPRSPYLCLKNKDDMGLSSDLLVSAESSAIDLHLPDHEANRPHHSHFAKHDSPSSSGNPSRSSSPGRNESPIPEKKQQPKVPKLPVAAAVAGKNNASGASSPSTPSILSPGRSNAPQFLTKIGEGIAHFIHDSYFGKKSLAHNDLRHAALLGCSQVPDYVALRDKEKILFSPVMYDNLVTAVTRKFTSEVLPQFLNSVSFQVMVSSLMITGFLNKKDGKTEVQEEGICEVDDAPLFRKDALLKNLWVISKSDENEKEEQKSDSDDTSSSSDDDTSEGEDEEDEKPSKPTGRADHSPSLSTDDDADSDEGE